MSGPDAQRALALYRQRAERYDRRMRVGERVRRRAVAAAALRPGETVLDVGCGTGATFALLEQAVGPTGRIIGLELSPQMLSVAERRIGAAGWKNVELVQGAVQELELEGRADAAVFVLAHDLLQSEQAIRAVSVALRPRGRVAAAGSMWAPRWLLPVNAYVGLKARRYITTFESFHRPWSKLEAACSDLQVERFLLGAAYAARGVVAN